MKQTIKKIALLILLPLSLVGCAYAPGIHLQYGPSESGLAQEQGDATVIPVTAELIAQQQLALQQQSSVASAAFEQARLSYEYKVGVQDILSVIVWEHPELTIPAGESRPADQSGHRVLPDGTIFFPYVGKIEVLNRTTDEIRLLLTQALATYIENPQLDVRVVSFRSKWLHVTGEVTKPGNQPITDIPVTVVDAINSSGGATLAADKSAITIVRNGEVEPIIVDLNAILERGQMHHNLLLQDGDIIHVPDQHNQEIYVMGEVLKPGTIPMQRRTLSLAQAISAAGGVKQDSGDAGRIFIIRQGAERPKVYHLNAERADTLLLTTKFTLLAQDVVLVSPTDLTRYNRVISQLVPTLNAIYTTDRLLNP